MITAKGRCLYERHFDGVSAKVGAGTGKSSDSSARLGRTGSGRPHGNYNSSGVTSFVASAVTFSGLRNDIGSSKEYKAGEGALKQRAADRSLCLSFRGRTIVSRVIEEFALVADISPESGSSVCAEKLLLVEEMLKLLFGDASTWNADTLVMDGIDDIIDGLLQSCDPVLSMHATRQALLPDTTTLQIQQAMKESSQKVGGDCTLAALCHGCQTVIRTTIPRARLRIIMHLLQYRPLGSALSTTIPIFVSRTEGWRQLLVRRVHCGLILGEFGINVQPDICKCCHDVLHQKLDDMSALLPLEDPPVLLRDYMPHSVLACAVARQDSGIGVVPNPRPGPASEVRRIQTLFWWFFTTIRDSWEQRSACNSIYLTRGEMACCAVRTPENEEAYVLVKNTMSPSEAERLAFQFVARAKAQFS